MLEFTQPAYEIDETVGALTVIMIEKDGGVVTEQTISLNIETDGTIGVGVAGEVRKNCYYLLFISALYVDSFSME